MDAGAGATEPQPERQPQARGVSITAYDLATRFVGLREVRGSTHNAHIVAMLRLDASWPQDDETPWCSAFANYVAWLLRLPRSKNLSARSWLNVGTPVDAGSALVGFDVVILRRGGGDQPGPEVLSAPGHVGFFAGWQGDSVFETTVLVLGGNQGDAVTLAPFPADRILGIRRLLGVSR